MRSSAGVRRHSGYAACAASIAPVTSAASAMGTRPSTSPVAGFTTSSHSEACDSTHSPLMKCGIFVVTGAATVIWITTFRNRKKYEIQRTSSFVCDRSVLSQLRRQGALLFRHLRQSRFEHIHSLVHLRVSNNQWHQQTDNIAIRSSRDQHHTVLVTVLRYLRGLIASRLTRSLGAHQFHRLHSAQSPDVADQLPLRLPLRRTLAKALA